MKILNLFVTMILLTEIAYADLPTNVARVVCTNDEKKIALTIFRTKENKNAGTYDALVYFTEAYNLISEGLFSGFQHQFTRVGLYDWQYKGSFKAIGYTTLQVSYDIYVDRTSDNIHTKGSISISGIDVNETINMTCREGIQH